jgi:hypothetical protein
LETDMAGGRKHASKRLGVTLRLEFGLLGPRQHARLLGEVPNQAIVGRRPRATTRKLGPRPLQPWREAAGLVMNICCQRGADRHHPTCGVADGNTARRLLFLHEHEATPPWLWHRGACWSSDLGDDVPRPGVLSLLCGPRCALVSQLLLHRCDRCLRSRFTVKIGGGAARRTKRFRRQRVTQQLLLARVVLLVVGRARAVMMALDVHEDVIC